MEGVAQPPEFHPEGDVWTHTLLMLDQLREPSVTLALGVLLHDVGKPPTFRVADRIRFDGHVEKGVEMAETDNISEDVADCLLRCAQRNGADLVVMGTHGRRGMSRITMGSVAEHFLRFSCCPVLLVRETW